MRVRIVPLNTSLLRVAFAARPTVTLTSDWPEDAEVINMIWDFDTRTAKLLVKSDTFNDVPVGDVPPEWSPTFTAHYVAGELMDLIAKVKADDRGP